MIGVADDRRHLPGVTYRIRRPRALTGAGVVRDHSSTRIMAGIASDGRSAIRRVQSRSSSTVRGSSIRARTHRTRRPAAATDARHRGPHRSRVAPGRSTRSSRPKMRAATIFRVKRLSTSCASEDHLDEGAESRAS